MRFPLRLALTLAVLALAAAACASVSPEELAERYDFAPAIVADGDLGILPTPTTSNSGGNGAGAIDTDDPSGDAAGSAQVDALKIESRRCPFATDAVPVDTECGTIVFEPEQGSTAAPVRVSFARFFASGSPEPDPVVYLHGGPGGAMLALSDLFYSTVVEPFIDGRDVILYDQRGAGESSPLPFCDDVYSLDDDFFASSTSHEALAAEYVELLSECGGDLSEQRSFDLSQYNSARHATDLAVLMASLSYESYNIYGSSYGSRLAQTIMRDYPARVRSVIMSGVYPLEENLIGSVPETFEAALGNIFQTCVDDPICGEHLPDPWRAFEDVVDALDDNPIPVEIPISQWSSYDALVAGDDLINGFHALLYTADDAAMIADTLIDFLDGEHGKIERIGRSGFYDIGDVAPYVAVQCREEVPFTTPEQAERAAASSTPYERVGLAPGLIGGDLIEICGAWESIGQADPIENEPVVWDAPTLLFSGGIDPITPPWWAENVAERLPHATLAHFADRGHDSDEGWCAIEIMAEFIDDPGTIPDIGCAANWDAPYLDNTPAAVRAPLSIELHGSAFTSRSATDVTLDVPADWLFDSYEEGSVWWRNLDWPDVTALVVTGGELDPEALYAYLDVEVAGSMDQANRSNGLGSEWTRFEKATGGLDIVSYTRNDDALSISLVGYDNEMTALERSVLVPVVASVRDR